MIEFWSFQFFRTDIFLRLFDKKVQLFSTSVNMAELMMLMIIIAISAGLILDIISFILGWDAFFVALFQWLDFFNNQRETVSWTWMVTNFCTFSTIEWNVRVGMLRWKKETSCNHAMNLFLFCVIHLTLFLTFQDGVTLTESITDFFMEDFLSFHGSLAKGNLQLNN